MILAHVVLACRLVCAQPTPLERLPLPEPSLPPRYYTHTTIMSGPVLPSAELERLDREAKAGSGEAAWTLARYYDMTGNDVVLALRYYKRAFRLNYPLAFYRAAFREWESDPHPNLRRVASRARKAVELGVKAAQDVLDEVEVARTSGVIPKRTAIRWVD